MTKLFEFNYFWGVFCELFMEMLGSAFIFLLCLKGSMLLMWVHDT